MPETPDPAAPCACPTCDKPCAWTPERAGRRLRCACGQIFRLPARADGRVVAETPPTAAAEAGAEPPAPPKPEPAPAPEPEPEPEPNVYEVNLPDDMQHVDVASAAASAPAVTGPTPAKCPSCNGRLRPGAVICMNCGFNLAEGGKIETRIETDPSPDHAGSKPAAAAAPAVSAAADAGAGAGAADINDERLKRALARTAGEQAEAAARTKRFHFQENILPLILIGAGVLVAVFNALVLAHPSQNAGLTADEISWGMGVGRGEAAGAYFAGAGKLLLVQIPCLFVGLFFCAAVMGSAFGTLGSVLKKLLALTLLGGSFYLSISMGVNILMYGMGGLGGIFTASVAIAVFWGVIKLLFDDLEIIEVVILYLAMCVLPFWILTAIQLFTMA